MNIAVNRVAQVGAVGAAQPVVIPAWVFLVIWFGFQLISSSASLQHPQSGGGVAFFAHIGGFVFGLLAVRLFKSRTWVAPAYR